MTGFLICDVKKGIIQVVPWVVFPGNYSSLQPQLTPLLPIFEDCAMQGCDDRLLPANSSQSYLATAFWTAAMDGCSAIRMIP